MRRNSSLPFGDGTILESSKASSTVLPQSETPDKTEHGAFFVDYVLPAQYSRFDIRTWLVPNQEASVISRITDLFSRTKTHGLKVVNVDPTPKDGGVFVNFTYNPPPDASGTKTLEEVEKSIRAEVEKAGGIRTWFGIGTGDFFRVKGKPWNEDLNVYPSNIIKIEFEGPDVHHEVLYDILRPYGRIKEMTKPTPVPAGTLRFIIVSFSRVRSGILARNCLHGIGVADDTLTTAGTTGSPTKTRLSITYETPLKAHAVRDWLSSHPRIVLPIAGVLLGSLTYTVFDPIRSMFVKLKVLGWLDYHDFKLYKFFQNNMLDKVTFKSTSETGNGDGADGTDPTTGSTAQPGPHGSIATTSDEWKEREEAESALYAYLSEAPSTVAIVHGPAGSGKTKMLTKVLKTSNRKVVTIDCAEIDKAGSDSAVIVGLAKQTGYWPVFSFLSSMNSMIDLASMGLIGQKAGFSTSVDQQMKEILEVVGGALKKVSAELVKEQKKKDAKEKKRSAPVAPPPTMSASSQTPPSDPKTLAPADPPSTASTMPASEKDPSVLHKVSSSITSSVTAVSSSVSVVTSSVQGATDNIQDFLAKKGILGEKAAEEEAVEQWRRDRDAPCGRRTTDEGVNALPVVILTNFGGKKEVLLDVLANWSAALVENGVAHVIAVSDNRENMRRLAKALPTRPLLSIPLGDADPVIALSFVKGKIQTSLSVDDESWVARLGGRANDLDSLVHKVQNGSSVRDAVEDIIARGVGELRKTAFGDDVEDTKNLHWKPEQAWAVLRRLAKDEEIPYADVLLEFPFKGDDAALREMEHAELITITTQDGLPISIRPGKPVYRYVFQRLLNDRIFHAIQDIAYNKSAIAAEEATIRKCEDELMLLRSIGPDMSGSFSAGKGATAARADYLLTKMKKSQTDLDALEREIKTLKKLLRQTKPGQA